MREQPKNVSSEIYLHDHCLRCHSRNKLYHLHSMRRLRNMHLARRRPALARSDSYPRGSWNPFGTPLPLTFPWKPHVSMIMIPKEGLKVLRLYPSHQDLACGRSAQHGLCFRLLDLDAPWLLWPCLLLKTISSLSLELERFTYGTFSAQFDSERVFSLQDR
jgi:hypothetical protein